MLRVALGALIAGVSLHAQDTTRTAPRPTLGASTAAARLRVVYRPPPAGIARDTALARSSPALRAVLPALGVDTMVPQTIRPAPFVAICATSQPDSVWLRVRVGTTINDVMIALAPGLNRIGLGATRVPINDGDIAEWSLASRSGELLLQERLERRVVRTTPTVNALATHGIWHDALDQFVSATQRGGDPLAEERMNTFIRSVGAAPCTAPSAP